ncbi:AAA family ATPase [Bacillus salinus]|uniref:AAA family ATPase n=1 Tax=Bacillus sp. HMF5848 TaxID=2495421 RepID=UPI0021AD8FE0|nr:AAA family ATPase [Bacillus sp. HMF5848]
MTEDSQTTRKKRGEMIVVCSAKGGAGRTIMTVNLAVSLFKKNISVCIVDGDFQFGDISLAMDLHPTFSIHDVIEEFDRIDEYSLAGMLCSHESGVKVLPAPERPEYAELVTQDKLCKILDMLLLQHDYVVVDTGVGLGDMSLQMIEKADQVLVLTNLEMATLKNSKLMIETLDVLGFKDKVQTIVNRATMESVIGASDVPDILGVDQPIYIPNDFQIASQSLNIGIPFVINQGKTELAKAVFKMAEQLTTRREITPIHGKEASIMSKLFGRRKVREGT